MKQAYVMRGIPGSGKSTVVHKLIRGYENPSLSVAVHSTDDLCMIDGEYRFDPALAGERHAQNLANFKESLDKGVPCVIVDNTNVKVSYYQPYVDAAEAAGYQVVIVELIHPSLDDATARNVHGVPREVVNQMILDWEPAQHCVTVEKMNEAWKIVHRLQDRARAYSFVYIALGILAGGFLAFVIQLVKAS